MHSQEPLQIKIVFLLRVTQMEVTYLILRVWPRVFSQVDLNFAQALPVVNEPPFVVGHKFAGAGLQYPGLKVNVCCWGYVRWFYTGLRYILYSSFHTYHQLAYV